MVVDWAVDFSAADEERAATHPHVHMLITMRVFDRLHRDVGPVRQNWLRTDKAGKALAEKWWKYTGIYPRSYSNAM